MFKNLRITFTILAALCLAAILPVSAFWSWVGVVICAVGAGFFWMLMLMCKDAQEKQEKENEPAHGDFFNPSTAAKENPNPTNDKKND